MDGYRALITVKCAGVQGRYWIEHQSIITSGLQKKNIKKEKQGDAAAAAAAEVYDARVQDDPCPAPAIVSVFLYSLR